MIIPIRCFSCGKPIAHLWEKFKKEIAKEKKAEEVFEEIGIERYCCKQLFLGHEDYIQLVAKFKREK